MMSLEPHIQHKPVQSTNAVCSTDGASVFDSAQESPGSIVIRSNVQLSVQVQKHNTVFQVQSQDFSSSMVLYNLSYSKDGLM